MTVHSYKSSGIVSHYIRDYAGDSISSQSNQVVSEFTFKQSQTQKISEVNYGTVGNFATTGVSDEAAILIVGEVPGWYLRSQTTVVFVSNAPPPTNANIYSYESGLVSESVGQYGTNTLGSLALRTIGSFTFLSDNPLFNIDNAGERVAYSYNPTIIDLYNELDYGSITSVHTQTINQGTLSDNNTTQVDYGRIIYVTNVESFGFVKLVSEASWVATQAYQGSGNLGLFGKERSPAFYNWIVDGKVRISGTSDPAFSPVTFGGGGSSLLGEGSIGITAITSGSGNLFTLSSLTEKKSYDYPATEGSLDIFGAAVTQRQRAYETEGTLFAFAGGDERKLFQYYGSGTINILARKPEEYRLSELANYTLGIHPGLDANLPLGQIEFYTGHTDIGNVQLRHLSKEFSHEKHTEVYTEESINYFEKVDHGVLDVCTTTQTITGAVSGNATGCIVSVNGTASIAPSQSFRTARGINAATNFIDYGLVSEAAAPRLDFGHILTTSNIMPNGLFKFRTDVGSADKFTPNWNGSGTIRLRNFDLIPPLDVSIVSEGGIKSLGGAAETTLVSEESTGLFTVTGTPVIVITAGIFGGGSLFGISGAAESFSANTPEETPIFKIGGTAEPPVLSRTEVASGTLFSFSGGDERNSFVHYGSGSITLLPRKPETYELSELSTFTLEEYQLCSSYINLGDTSFYSSNTELGCAQLKWLNAEESHEKHTEVYDLGLCNDNPEIDYGLIADANALACVTINGGTVTTNTTATTGCTKVAVGTVLTIAPGVTYKVPPQLTTPTAVEDYGLVSETYNPRRDYGHILETIGIICPFGEIGIFHGSADVAFSRPTVGTAEIGGFIKLRGEAEVFYTPPYIVEGIIGRISGEGTTLFSLLHPSEGGIFKAFSGSAETVLWDPDLEQLGWELRGTAVPVFSLAHFGSGTIRITPGVDQARSLRPPAGGVINIDGTAIESFIANPPEEAPLFRFTGTLDESFATEYVGEGTLFSFSGSSELLTFAEQPEVNIKISGVAEAPRTRAFVGSGSLKKFSGLAESFTANPQERQLLFSFTGAATEVLSANPPEDGAEIRLSGSTTPEILTFSEQPFGTISIFGESKDAFVPSNIGSGSLFAFAGAAEAVGFNPPDITTDIKFFGTAEEIFSANPPEEGAKVRVTGDAFPVFFVPKYPASGLITITGDADTDRARSFIGSGSLRKISGAAESVTFNPDEKQMLFSFTGESTIKHTEVYVGVDTPIRLRRGSLSDFQTYDFQPNWNAFGVITVSGDVGVNFVPNNVGFGNIFTIGGSAEAVTFNPDEKQMLFSFTGELAERTTASHVGEGNLFAFSGGAERVAYVPTLLADIRLNGQVGIRYVPNNIGFGNIFTIGGSAESITFNPDERQLLFSFTGEVVESFGVAETKQIEVDIAGDGSFIRSRAYEGSGTISVFGESSNKLLINNVGFGNIFNIGGSAEAVTFNPEERQMLFSFTGERIAEKRTSREISQGGVITITGTAGDPSLAFAEQPTVHTKISGKVFFTTHRSITGTGSLFAFSGGAEAVGAVPPTEQALFRVVGDSENNRSAVYVGSGSLRKLSGAAESVSFNPDERQMLFSFTGERISEKRTSREISQGGTLKVSGESSVLLTLAHQGEGTIPVTGDTKFTRARDFVGFGTLRKLSGAAESLTFNPTERDMLFSFTGERIAERTTFRELGTAGKFTFTGTSGDPLLTFAEQPFVNIDVTGDSVDIRSRAYQSTGTLFAINNVDEAFVRTGYQGSGSLKLSGIALVQVQLFQPSRVYVWII